MTSYLEMVVDPNTGIHHWAHDGFLEMEIENTVVLVRGVQPDERTLCGVVIGDAAGWSDVDWPIRAADFCLDCWRKADKFVRRAGPAQQPAGEG